MSRRYGDLGGSRGGFPWGKLLLWLFALSVGSGVLTLVVGFFNGAFAPTTTTVNVQQTPQTSPTLTPTATPRSNLGLAGGLPAPTATPTPSAPKKTACSPENAPKTLSNKPVDPKNVTPPLKIGERVRIFDFRSWGPALEGCTNVSFTRDDGQSVTLVTKTGVGVVYVCPPGSGGILEECRRREFAPNEISLLGQTFYIAPKKITQPGFGEPDNRIILDPIVAPDATKAQLELIELRKKNNQIRVITGKITGWMPGPSVPLGGAPIIKVNEEGIEIAASFFMPEEGTDVEAGLYTEPKAWEGYKVMYLKDKNGRLWYYNQRFAGEEYFLNIW